MSKKYRTNLSSNNSFNFPVYSGKAEHTTEKLILQNKKDKRLTRNKAQYYKLSYNLLMRKGLSRGGKGYVREDKFALKCDMFFLTISPYVHNQNFSRSPHFSHQKMLHIWFFQKKISKGEQQWGDILNSAHYSTKLLKGVFFVWKIFMKPSRILSNFFICVLNFFFKYIFNVYEYKNKRQTKWKKILL